jgi:hypothetical protein
MVFFNGYPWITIGGIPFISVLLAFVVGGFSAVIERFIEIFEKKNKGK